MSEKQSKQPFLTRRQFMQRGAAVVTGALLAACADNSPAGEVALQDASQAQPAATPPATLKAEPTATRPVTQAPGLTPTEAATGEPASTSTLEPTPLCMDDDETLSQTAGPFYTPNTPERTSFWEEGTTGIRLVLTGRVLARDCTPLAGAVLDFWHADDGGEYDNAGYRFRGHQFADDQGLYRLETIIPGLYPGRTRHIHVIVQGPATSMLTTQLYFPGEPRNASDGLFQEALLIDLQDAADGQAATFDFVLART